MLALFLLLSKTLSASSSCEISNCSCEPESILKRPRLHEQLGTASTKLAEMDYLAGEIKKSSFYQKEFDNFSLRPYFEDAVIKDNLLVFKKWPQELKEGNEEDIHTNIIHQSMLNFEIVTLNAATSYFRIQRRGTFLNVGSMTGRKNLPSKEEKDKVEINQRAVNDAARRMTECKQYSDLDTFRHLLNPETRDSLKFAKNYEKGGNHENQAYISDVNFNFPDEPIENSETEKQFTAIRRLKGNITKVTEMMLLVKTWCKSHAKAALFVNPKDEFGMKLDLEELRDVHDFFTSTEKEELRKRFVEYRAEMEVFLKENAPSKYPVFEKHEK